jgi:hypothetical protein
VSLERGLPHDYEAAIVRHDSFAFPPHARQNRAMPECPGDPQPPTRPQTDRERAEAAGLREIAQKAPPLPAVKPSFPTEPAWSAGLDWVRMCAWARPERVGDNVLISPGSFRAFLVANQIYSDRLNF